MLARIKTTTIGIGPTGDPSSINSTKFYRQALLVRQTNRSLIGQKNPQNQQTFDQKVSISSFEQRVISKTTTSEENTKLDVEGHRQALLKQIKAHQARLHSLGRSPQIVGYQAKNSQDEEEEAKSDPPSSFQKPLSPNGQT